jgi:dTDP-glucose pyrophosphorylase
MSQKQPTIQLLFPMGGLGTRFFDIGIKTPKPLIEVDGQPMVLKAISSFARLKEMGAKNVRIQPIFIVRSEHEAQFGLGTLLQKVAPEAKLVLLDHNTRGAVETCLVAEPHIDKNSPLVICDCDLYFRSREYEDILLQLALDEGQKDEQKGENSDSSSPSGLLVYMEHTHPRYSYALTREDDNRTVIRTAEKDPISNKALIGGYGFASGAVFLKAAHQLMELPIDPEKGRKEYYISLLYNFLLQEGLKVVAVKRDEYESFGTPEELKEYNESKKK